VQTEAVNTFRPGTIAAIIAGVSVSTALLAWCLWRVCKSVERAERDPRYLRRRLFWLGMMYLGAAVFGIEEVARGKEPIQTLIGLPIGLALAWFWLRMARRVKVPPP
jgi:membrane protein implicated in regulation of membrane protease activity